MRFEQSTHQYFNSSDQEYVSVTTLIHNYIPEFDGEYWSMYKSIKKAYLEVYGESGWSDFKWSVGGWKQVVANFDESNPLWILVKQHQSNLLEEWKIENKRSTDRGTKIHNAFEENVRPINHKGTTHVHSQVNPLEVADFESSVYHNELLVYSHPYRVAGQVDKVIRRGKVFDIIDYKTNKKLVYYGFLGETMKAPLDHYQNANFWHYTLQLSLYAWIISSYGYEVGDLTIAYIYGDNDDKIQMIPVEYRKKDIELMLEDYASI